LVIQTAAALETVQCYLLTGVAVCVKQYTSHGHVWKCCR